MSRRYSEAEMRAVFAQAARTPAPSPSAEGLTLDELQRIGVSAGLDPDRIAAAVASLDQPADEGSIRWGMRDTLRSRRVLAATFSDAEWETAVAYLRATYGGPGTSGQTGRTREWTSPGPYSGGSSPHGQVYVAVRPLDDSAMTEVTFDYPTARQGRELALGLGGLFAALGLVLPLVVGLLSGNWGKGLPVGGMLLGLGVLLAVFIRAAVLHQQRSVGARFEASLDRLDLIARRDASPLAAPLVSVDGALGQDDATARTDARNRTV